MKELTKITDTLFCVEVPMEATNFGWLYGMFTYDIVDGGKSKTKMISEVDDWMQSIGKNQRVELLGYCTDKEISFEVENFINTTQHTHLKNNPELWESVKLTLLYSQLLLPNGLYWDINDMILDVDNMNYNELLKELQSLEAAKINGKLVFLKLIK